MGRRDDGVRMREQSVKSVQKGDIVIEKSWIA